MYLPSATHSHIWGQPHDIHYVTIGLGVHHTPSELHNNMIGRIYNIIHTCQPTICTHLAIHSTSCVGTAHEFCQIQHHRSGVGLYVYYNVEIHTTSRAVCCWQPSSTSSTTRSTSKNGYLCGKYFLISRISIMEIFPQHHKQ